MRTEFNYSNVWTLYERNHASAERLLKRLPVYCGGDVKTRGLSGWVFEQVIYFCLRKELRSKGISCEFAEQVSLGGRAKADLKLGERVLIEIKLSGAYSKESYSKYAKYRRAAAKLGCAYLWFSGEESYTPYRSLARKAFGRSNTFYFDSTNDWQRFVSRIAGLLKQA